MTIIAHSGDYERGALDALDYVTDERPDLEDVTMRAAEKIGANIVAGHRRDRGAVKALERIHTAIRQHVEHPGGHTPALQVIERESAPYAMQGGQWG